MELNNLSGTKISQTILQGRNTKITKNLGTKNVINPL